MLGTLQQVGVVRILGMKRVAPKQQQILSFEIVFDTSHHPYHVGEVRVPDGTQKSSRRGHFPRKPYWSFQKKYKKVCPFVCWIKLDPYSFYFNVFGLVSFIELIYFFNFIPSHLIFISDLVFILLITMYLVLNHLSSFLMKKKTKKRIKKSNWKSENQN